MASFDAQEVQTILRRVRRRLGEPEAAASETATPRLEEQAGGGVFSSIDAATEAAWEAFQVFAELGLERRRAIIDALRRAMRRDAAELPGWRTRRPDWAARKTRRRRTCWSPTRPRGRKIWSPRSSPAIRG